MKKIIYLLILAAVLIAMASCGWFTKTGPLEGMEIHIEDGLGTRSRGGTNHAVPDGVEIAFTKIWFPAPAAFTALKAANPNNSGGQIFVNHTSDFSGEFYKALDRGVNDPYVFNTATSGPFTPSTSPPYGAVYHGVLLETVYFQMDMPTYSIRWYQKDSGAYKAQDVLVKTDGGWKFAYLERTTEFDFSYNPDIPEPDPKHNVSGEAVTGLKLITQDTRLSADQYYESWLNASCTKSDNYVNMALQAYPHPNYYNPDANDILLNYYKNKAEEEGILSGADYTLTNQTLVQYFRLTKDVPNNAGGDHYNIGVNQDDGYWKDEGGLLMKAELIAGYGPDAYDNPKVIETFTEAENEAKMYKIEISFATDSPDAFACGLGIDTLPDPLDADSTWTQIVSHAAAKNFVSLSPITGGKEIAFGWLDFNDVWQGEFSAGAGE